LFLEETRMIKAKKLTGLALATAAAGLFAAAGSGNAYAGTESKIQCAGVNACRGQSECATINNECQGHNDCKGEGWLYTTADECRAKGGRIEN
jgi:hypothetical protein